MGDFSPVVLILTCAMDNGRKDLPMCSRITPKLVGDQLPGCLPLMFQGPTKEAFSGSTISALGDHNIDYVPILIDCSPQVVTLASDFNEQFIDVPDVAEPSLFPPQISRIGQSELSTPESDRFIGDKDSSLRKQLFYISKAQGEPMV